MSGIRGWVLVLLGLLGCALLLGVVWLGFASDAKITALRNAIHYQAVHRLGGPTIRSDEPPGSLSGIVRDAVGAPVDGALVLVSSPLGHTYTARSDAAGRYHIAAIPPGRYVPIAGKRGYRDALEQTCAAGLCFNRTASIDSDREAQEVDLTLAPGKTPEITVDDSLATSPTLRVEVGAPFPSAARRTHFRFEREGLALDGCYVYEPLTGSGPLPVLLLVLPGPVLNWEIIPVPFAAEGFSVLACYPLRGIEIDEDVADLLTALEYLRQGRLSSRADTENLGLIGASFTSIHAYRLLAKSDEVDVALVLGGMSDGFAFRHDLETGAVHTRPPFDQVNMALGFPNSSPGPFYQYSVRYHLDGLPPLCLLHGIEDELSPFSQSVLLAKELDSTGHPHEFHAYEGLSHYFSTSADNETTQRMFGDSLDCLNRFLEGR